ncbi:MAG: sensor histidine kinase [Ktedonobacteraceae bacterium]
MQTMRPTDSFQSIRRQRFFFQAALLRTLLEAVILGIVGGLVLLLWERFLSPASWQISLNVLFGAVCVLVFVLRLRLPKAFLQRQSFYDGMIAIILCLVLSGMQLVFTLILFPDWGANPPLQGISRTVLFIPLVSLIYFSVFVVTRVVARILMFWNHLRRTQLIWSLTHAIVMLVAMGAVLLILIFEVIIIRYSPNILLLIPATLGLISVSVIALAAVVPPSALFSYLVIRRTTRRVKELAVATSILRRGNYAVRVPVVGEDEVAQLQSNFNAMAVDLERAMRDLQGERDRVAALLQSRRELIANVSHELRTPMATLRSYLETTLTHWEEAPPLTMRRDLQVMENEAIRLQALVEDLFTLARTEVGRLTLHCIPTDVVALTQRIVETSAPLAWRASKVEVVIDASPAVPCALVDPDRLEQALRNLLHNGVRHTPPGGIVAVVLRTEEHAVILQVKDTGEGIASTDIPHIWERFYRSESSRTNMGSGTGLGLALVKEWIEAMGGSVAVESTVGEGSCFTLRLPLDCVEM